MSNGELNQSESPWNVVSFDATTLRTMVTPEVDALEDARGDVKGATERLVGAVRAAQKDVEKAQEAAAKKQQAVTDRLHQFNLVGRTITVDSAVSLNDGEPLQALDEEEKADGVSVITQIEFGTFNGEPIEPPDAIVLHVDERGRDWEFSFAFVANETARFTIDEIPHPDEQSPGGP